MLDQVLREREPLLSGNELVDAHCHLDAFPDPSTTIKDARFGGIRNMITAGGSKAASLEAIRIASSSEGVFAVIGIDPQNAKNDYGFVEEIGNLIKANGKVVGIGEIGIDNKVGAEKQLQNEVFERQIEIAKALDVPIVVHSRQAIDEVVEIIKRHEVKKAMFHFFEGDEEKAKLLADMGYVISIPPIESQRRRRVINKIDIRNIAVETDSPVVGKSPLDVIRIVEWIAEIKGIPFSEASLRITQNVKRLFSI
ncbi:MAG: TatD family hydrolase [Candidatus Micrarchaeaceae archaeon]